ncbi:hypothetical protein Ancab_004903 [Ancistrocladus abbreviatus]
MWESMLGFGTLGKMRSNGNKRLDELQDANLLENVNEVEKKVVKSSVHFSVCLSSLGSETIMKLKSKEKRNGGIMFKSRTLLATDVWLDSGKHQYLLSCLHIPESEKSDTC